MIQRARMAIDRLPPRQRSAVVLAYLGQRSSTEVAEIQGVPRGTVKSRIRAGIASVRQAFAEDGSRRRPIYERAEGTQTSDGGNPKRIDEDVMFSFVGQEIAGGLSGGGSPAGGATEACPAARM